MHHFERSDADSGRPRTSALGVARGCRADWRGGRISICTCSSGVIAQFIVYLAVAIVAADFVSNWLLGDRHSTSSTSSSTSS